MIRGWEVIPEPKKKHLALKRTVDMKDPAADGRLAHVRNFLNCVRSRQAPVENPEIAQLVSTVAHLGNIAQRTGSKIVWDARQERAVGEPKADPLIARSYRKPWSY